MFIRRCGAADDKAIVIMMTRADDGDEDDAFNDGI